MRFGCHNHYLNHCAKCSLKIAFELTFASFMWIFMPVPFSRFYSIVFSGKKISFCHMYPNMSLSFASRTSINIIKHSLSPTLNQVSVHVNILHSAVIHELAGRWMFTSADLEYQPILLRDLARKIQRLVFFLMYI